MAKRMSDEQFHRIARALADPRRIEILERLRGQQELACTSLRECVPVTAATMSHHLKELADAGLITLRRESKFAHISLSEATLEAYVAELSRRTGLRG